LIEWLARKREFWKQTLLPPALAVAILAVPFAGVGLSAQGFAEGAPPSRALQTAGESKGTGVLVGHVVCDDTGKPARLARVFITPVNPTARRASGNGPPGAGGAISGSVTVDPGEETDLGGWFMRTELAAGTYRVTSLFPGYVANSFEYQRALERGDDAAAEAAEKQILHVTIDGGTKMIEIRLKRGATLSGKVRFPDGGPAVGMNIDLLRVEPGRRPTQFNPMGSSFSGPGDTRADDEGHYRFAGLPPGRYMVRARTQQEYAYLSGLVTGGNGFSSTVGLPREEYYSGADDGANARVFELSGGEAEEADIRVDPGSMHEVLGRVVSDEDGHATNGDILFLTRHGDSGESQMADIQQDGSFRLEHVRDGKYELVVRAGDSSRRHLGGFPANLVVKDHRCNYADVKLDLEMAGRNIDVGSLTAHKGWQAKDVASCAEIAKQGLVTGGNRVTVRVALDKGLRPARSVQVGLIPLVTNMNESALFPDLQKLTGFDGIAVFEHVKAEEYYVLAEAPGYVSAVSRFSRDEIEHPTPNTIEAAKQVIQRINVTDAGQNQVELRLKRGATIEGDVKYEDGSPAANLSIEAIVARDGKDYPVVISLNQQRAESYHGTDGFTDDRGQYRISGLPAGDYLVRTSLPVGDNGSDRARGFGAFMLGGWPFHQSIDIYAPGVERRDGARLISVNGGERQNVGLIVPLSRLHSVQGRAVQPDGAANVTFVNARLEQEGVEEVREREVKIASDGSFQISNVAPGQYTLKLFAQLEDQRSSMGFVLLRAEQPIAIEDKDVTGLVLKLAR
jgi:protocatechuate 3,4-dioxygenase beta subunit